MAKYRVSDYLHEALQSLLPPEDLAVSEWAEKYRVLDERTSNIAGPWSNAVTPYLAGIMDAYNDPDVEEIVFCKPSQVGGTEAANNILGYIVAQNPRPTLIVYPSDKLAKWVSLNRLQPMFRRSPQLRARFRDRQSSILELQFDGMYIALTGAESPSSLASRPIGDLILDEVDKFPSASTKEADPISLAKERTKTFPNRKIFMTSTPTVRSGQIWTAMEAADAIKHYFVPCPRCGEMIELRFGSIRWPDDENMTYNDRAEFAHYVCQECGGRITDRDKPIMLRSGQWRTVTSKAAVHRSMAFWINTLYSPFTRFSEIAREFLAAKAEPERLQNFVNSWLAEPWEDTRFRTGADLVMQRRTEVPACVVPEWAELLTGGIDVQETCMYWVIRAWGKYLTSQNIAYGKAVGFGDVEFAMNQEYCSAAGRRYVVNLAAVDSGDQTEDVYDFCTRNAEWAVPVKGVSQSLGPHYFRLTTLEANRKRASMQLLMVDGGKYKDTIAARMQRDNGQGSYMTHADTDEEYATQLTAEQKITVTKNGRKTETWVPKTSHAANHYLDAEVYAFAAADYMEVRSLHLLDDPSPPAPAAPEKKPSGGWLKGGSYE